MPDGICTDQEPDVNTRIAFALALALLTCGSLSACEGGNMVATAVAGATPAVAVTLVD